MATRFRRALATPATIGRRTARELRRRLEDTSRGDIETRVPNADIGAFLRRAARSNDLLIIGASHERGFLSLLIPPPTFEGSTTSRSTWPSSPASDRRHASELTVQPGRRPGASPHRSSASLAVLRHVPPATGAVLAGQTPVVPEVDGHHRAGDGTQYRAEADQDKRSRDEHPAEDRTGYRSEGPEYVSHRTKRTAADG